MSQHEIDLILKEQVTTILAANGQEADDWQLQPITNSFQDKNNVYKIDIAQDTSFVLKLEHTFFESNLAKEAHVLQFLATINFPAPQLIGTGICDQYHISHKYPRYLLMEYLEGIPLNWVYYQANVKERRIYLEQVIKLVYQLSNLQVKSTQNAPCLGSIASNITQQENSLTCRKLDPFNQETVGPFTNIDDMFQQQIGFWLNKLKERQAELANTLYKVWQKLDRSLLTANIPICLAHADIAPMNIIVDPQTKQLKGLIDWEFAGFYPIDMDFHSLFYFDQHQNWKWCGAKDVALAQHIIADLQLTKPTGYDTRLVWFDLLQLTKDLYHYQDWFAQQPKQQQAYEISLTKRMQSLLHMCGLYALT